MTIPAKFFLLTLMAVGLSACSSTQDDAYMGSRDDIIVKNRNMPEAVKEKAIEDAEKMAREEANRAVQQAAANDPVTTLDEVADEMAQPSLEPMETTQMASAPGTETATMQQESPASVAPAAPANLSGDLPPNARPGECYAKVLIPAVTENRTERVQISEERKVLARIVPAKYDVQTERVLVKEARQYWKQGHGPVEKVDATTGQIMCLVEEPAVYKTIEKRVLVEPERPEYKMIPAQFENITRSYVVTPERMEWRRILCETNVTPSIIIRIQQALQAKGYSVGAIDGRLGAKTMNAMTKFQAANGLAKHGITYETLEYLGVPLAGAGA
ncbi:MAG: peptidoglycan-binding protein [Alphaproteobacteria bacterium]|nr:peptidoglycan-binding protein [Alphaproteobacteria bacterium]